MFTAYAIDLSWVLEMCSRKWKYTTKWWLYLSDFIISSTKVKINKHSLQNAFKVVGKGLLPPKVTGTRWLPHVYRAITALLRSYKALEMTLSTASHKNPKAEGLVKIMLDKNVMAFILLLQVITCTQMYVLLVRDVIFLSCIMYKNVCQSM
jgi:hypothetical protein